MDMERVSTNHHKWLDQSWLQTKAPRSIDTSVLRKPKSLSKYAQRGVANLRGMEKKHA